MHIQKGDQLRLVTTLGIGALLCASPLVAQTPEIESDGIRINARVVEALPSQTAAQAINQLTGAIPVSSVQGERGNRAPTIDIRDLGEVQRSMRVVESRNPGVVISMAVLNPDGTVARTVTGDDLASLVGGADIPQWMWDAEAMAAGTSMIRREASGYYLYINIAACDV